MVNASIEGTVELTHSTHTLFVPPSSSLCTLSSVVYRSGIVSIICLIMLGYCGETDVCALGLKEAGFGTAPSTLDEVCVRWCAVCSGDK